MKHFSFALVLMLVATPALAQSLTQRMAGRWFGSGQPGDRSSMYIDSFHPDGRFAAQFRACVKGKADEQASTGRWRMTGNMLTIETEMVDDKPNPRTDVYRILSVDARTQRYVLVRTSFAYSASKVDDKFQMPPCDLVS